MDGTGMGMAKKPFWHHDAAARRSGRRIFSTQVLTFPAISFIVGVRRNTPSIYWEGTALNTALKHDLAKKYAPKRTALMLAGILLIGVSVALYRMSGLGADAYSCMNLGISGFLRISFGTWQLIINAFILIAVWFLDRRCIGPGTIFNMVFVGYAADFLCWLFLDRLGLPVTVPLRILLLLLGTLSSSMGCACYMAADMGISPYDAVAPILTKYAGGKVSFRTARVAGDAAAILTGVAFCLLARGSVWEIVGLGTVVNAVCNGPLIQFFRRRAEKILNQNIPKNGK